jgi:hypothetical protein
MPQTIRNVPVHATSVTAVNVVLSVGAVEQTVEVSASAAVVETTASMAARAVGPGQTEVREQMFTPRVRDYFPETLYWAPSVLTDGNGKAKLQFKLADDITTWKVSVLASTKDGSISFADKELRAFQPFFVDHDPPKVLTVGDYVELPVVVRNYLASLQNVRVEMKPAPWFSLTKTAQQLSVPPSDAVTAHFPIRATAAIDDGKQQVTAANSSLGDAIAKSIRVHPNGKDESVNASEILSGNGELTFTLPDDVIPGSQKTQLRIFPNLAAELAHSMEATLERPHGCGEQTISSTYPSLMLLRVYRSAGEGDSPLKRKADKYLHAGYQRLLEYQDSSGGFTYWGRGTSDIALTAYAIRFLRDSSEFIEEAEKARVRAIKWLISKQRPDGSWQPPYGSAPTLTSYVLQILSGEIKNLTNDATRTAVEDSVKRGSRFMAALAAPEPYVQAELALALYESGDIDGAKTIANQLRKTAHREGSSAYWSLDTNTPFYGWGRVGRVESTAVVLTALSQIDGSTISTDELTRAGIKFLMSERDKYGVWYSGQTTVNVLNTLIAAIKFGKPSDTLPHVTVNGRIVAIPVKSTDVLAPIYADVTDTVRAGANSVKLSSAQPENYLNIQTSSQYYVPWTSADKTDTRVTTGDTHGLRIGVKYDKTTLSVRNEVRCDVKVERFGHSGYGMLIAEVGLPPAAEVERSSLEKAMDASGWALSQYDILPDRVVLYLWPTAAGSSVSFTFRPRMALDALTAPSRVYDYYNPDSQTTLAPTRFRISN